MHRDVPFYGQSWNLSAWSELGFSSEEDAQYWERSSCGVLCLKMAIDATRSRQHLPTSPPLIEYIRRGVGMQAYADAVGWKHDGLARLAASFGVTATPHHHVRALDLARMIDEGGLPVISISWAFQRSTSLKSRLLFWKKCGGHLALVTGYERRDGKLSALVVHHTSIRPEYNWEHRTIPLPMFEPAFTGRCVTVHADTPPSAPEGRHTSHPRTSALGLMLSILVLLTVNS